MFSSSEPVMDRQTVATIQLTPEEGEQYRTCPVYLNFHTGFYVFPVCPICFYAVNAWRH